MNADPAKKTAKPQVQEQAKISDISSPKWFLNRELTWLQFNRRVLAEGQDMRTPLLERVFFLAVVGYARLTGGWHTDVPETIFYDLIPRASQFGHP